MFSVLLDRYIGLELLGQKGNLCVTLQETAMLFSKVAEPLISTLAVCQGYVSPHPCQ